MIQFLQESDEVQGLVGYFVSMGCFIMLVYVIKLKCMNAMLDKIREESSSGGIDLG